MGQETKKFVLYQISQGFGQPLRPCTYYSIFKIHGGPQGPQFSEESMLPLVQLEETRGKSMELVTQLFQENLSSLVL